MATTSVTSPLAKLPASSMADTPGTTKAADDANTTSDRFLKLLVTQMQNQDPLNPMDNAQVTSQMAQINTVNGIEKLNTGLQSLSTQFMQMQVMQGTALVGRDVVVPGNHLAMKDGLGEGGYELTGAAKSVKVEVRTTAGQVLDSFELGAQKSGVHTFEWNGEGKVPQDVDPSKLIFKVTSSTGTSDARSEVATLMLDRVNAVSTNGKSLNLDLEISGPVDYSKVKSFN